MIPGNFGNDPRESPTPPGIVRGFFETEAPARQPSGLLPVIEEVFTNNLGIPKLEFTRTSA
jgi:hypothetical protein